jgi:hypothetical protein
MYFFNKINGLSLNLEIVKYYYSIYLTLIFCAHNMSVEYIHTDNIQVEIH